MAVSTVGQARRLVDTPKRSDFIDMTERIYGRLKVVGYAGKASNGHSEWVCQCECGSVVKVRGSLLRRGETRSCGCLAKEVASRTHRVHGKAKTRLYAAWKAMRQRCQDNNHPGYSNYGGRGIKVCERWESFENFAEDMGPTFKPGLSLDRIDNDGDYEPQNCRWVTRRVQANNTRANRYVDLDGDRLTVTQAARRVGLEPRLVISRIHRGWTVEEALYTPKGANRGSVE